MNKKGFTLIELLVVFVIITLVSSIALVSYNSFFKEGSKKYYKSLESDAILAGNDYFQDNRDKLPVASNYSEVSLSELIEKKYMQDIKDANGQTCNGKVFVYKENGSYKYETCLVCEDYESTGTYCGESTVVKSINITARTISGKSYNPNVSYANVQSADNENVKVMFNMSDASVSKYKITNVNTGSRFDCNANASNYCEKEIDTSGSYYVTAYDKDGKVLVSNQQMSIKIFRSGIDFSITGVNGDYTLNQTACSGNKKATVNFSIDRNNSSTEYYKKIEYKVMRINSDGKKEVAYSNVITRLNDNFSIGSGHYQIEVTVTNEADVPLTKKSSEFDVSYKAILNYGDVENEEYRVVKGYPYNLPDHVSAYGASNLEVKWYKGTTRIYPETIVGEDCIHEINGDVTIVVNVPTNLTSYCKTGLTYTGSEQTLTKTIDNVTFSNNKKTDAGNYTVTAHIDSPKYMWSDGTFADKTFNCSIGQVPATLTCANKSYNGSEQTLYSNSTGCKSVTNGKKTNVGTYTLTCVPDDNHTAPSTCSAKINTVVATLTCANKSYTGSEQTLYSNSTGCKSVTDGKKTDVGTYTLTCVPDDNHTAPSTCDAKITAATCDKPTSVSISNAGKVTWTASSNCNGAQHQISIDGSTWTNATSGVDYKSTIIASTGTRTVYVRAKAPSSNFKTSDSASASKTVYSVSLKKGTNVTSVSGAGNYISGSSATINASFSNPYYFVNWTGTVTNTTKNATITVDKDYTLTANVGDGCASGNTSSSTSYGSCVATTCKRKQTVTVTSNRVSGYVCSTTETNVNCTSSQKCWRYQADFGGSDECGSSRCPPLCGFPIDTSQPGNGTESHLNEWRCQSSKTKFNTAANYNEDWNAFFGRYCWCKTTG